MKKPNLFLVAIAFAMLTFGLWTLNSFAQYTRILDFTGANGANPYGDVLYDGTFLYGMTINGGIHGVGAIFKVKPDGTGYAKLLDFSGGTDGRNPDGTLISDGTFLYGTTMWGGTNNMGIIFKIMPDGTGYTKILDFSGTANGNKPLASLFYDGTFLYGMTREGGTSSLGVLFKIKPDGTAFSKLLDFDGTNGSYPGGSLISDGTFLYGTTYNGGTENKGTIFKIKPDGTGYTKLYDCEPVNGCNPACNLLPIGSYLYGMTELGGTSYQGVIFKIKPDGTGYTKMLDFTSGDIGGVPAGSLISDGTFLYGMTQVGGTANTGVLFKIMPDGTGFSKLMDFELALNGSRPNGSLIFDGSFLYGMTTDADGVTNYGTVFKYGITTGLTEHNPATGFKVYPNPTTGKFTVESSDGQGINGKVEICNVFGVAVYSENINQPANSEIDLSGSPKGIYFVTISSATTSYTRKIVVQ